MSIVERLFSFHGRLRRRDWWLYSILLGVAGLGLTAAVMALLGGSIMPSLSGDQAESADVGGWMVKRIEAGAIASLVLAWPGLAVGVKRLHDRGRSGWWLLLLSLLFWAGQAIALTPLIDRHVMSLKRLVSLSQLQTTGLLLVGLWLFVEMGFLGGKPDANRFGPSPKASQAEAEA